MADSEKESNSSSPVKRRLPLWLTRPTKKTKSSENNAAVYDVMPKETEDSPQSQPSTSDQRTANSASSVVEGPTSTDPVPDSITDMPSSSVVSEIPKMVKVKEEPVDEDDAVDSPTIPSPIVVVRIKEENVVKVKEEATSPESTSGVASSTIASAAVVKVENIVKQEATSTSRPMCKFGMRCYRRNPAHKAEECHPGDPDYCMPDYPAPPAGTPLCPFGSRCYRRNPLHFQQYSHSPPADPDGSSNNGDGRNRVLRRYIASRLGISHTVFDDLLDSEEPEDPFANDGGDDADFIPSQEDDETEDFEFSADEEGDEL